LSDAALLSEKIVKIYVLEFVWIPVCDIEEIFEINSLFDILWEVDIFIFKILEILIISSSIVISIFLDL